MRVAVDVPSFELASYQKAVRLLLRHPLVTPIFPDERALPLIRRWSEHLRADLNEMFGYRLELHGQTARLVRVHDGLDGTRPGTVKDRTLDRKKYAYLMLAQAVLGRAGTQITLGELAAAVAADAGRISGLGLDPDAWHDRKAFVDAVLWLEERGALRVADGSTASWARDPDSAEALYDIARDVLVAIYRPSRVLQHVTSVAALVERPQTASANAQRRAAGQRARRAVIEQPVVYFHHTDQVVRNHLRSTAIVEDLERLTGLRLERRSEGVLLVDTASLSGDRFPSTGPVAQTALLLLGAMADRIVDPDQRRLPRHPAPYPALTQRALIDLVDTGLPTTTALALDDTTADEPSDATSEPDGSDEDEGKDDTVSTENLTHPLISESFLRTTMKELFDRYGVALGEKWRADPDRLKDAAIELLARYQLVAPVPGGVLVLPLAGRYRNVQAKLRRRDTPAALFDVKPARRSRKR